MKWANKDVRSEPLTEASPFPFGKYGPKGESPSTMSGVPSDYYVWLQQQPWLAEWPAVKAYIEERKVEIAKAFALTGKRFYQYAGDSAYDDCYDYGDIEY